MLEKEQHKGRYFSKINVVPIVGFGFNQMWKISDVQVVGSAVTTVLKKVVPAVRKSCDNYHEKAVPTVRKNCLL